MNKSLILILLIVILAIFLLKGRNSSTTKPINTNSPSLSVSQDVGYSGASFGIMLIGSQMSPEKKVQIAKEMGVTFFRPEAIRVNQWNGTCNICDTIIGNGLKLSASITNKGGAGEASAPPSDSEMPEFKKKVEEILTKYPMDIVVVENEENSNLFYTGSPEAYGKELKVVCDIAHAKGLKCTNGGLVNKLNALLVYNNYKNQGKNAEADDFANRVFTAEEKRILNSAQVKAQITRGEGLLAQYKSAGADYVNFHWYIADTKALEEVVSYLQEKTDLPAISNEVGQQKNEDPRQVTNTLQKLIDLKIPFVLWFSMDVPGFAQARGLTEPDGTLRPNGLAFKEFVTRYKK